MSEYDEDYNKVCLAFTMIFSSNYERTNAISKTLNSNILINVKGQNIRCQLLFRTNQFYEQLERLRDKNKANF